MSNELSDSSNHQYQPVNSHNTADVPHMLEAELARIWQLAVDEASSRLSHDQKAEGVSLEEVRRVNDDAMSEMQRRCQELENRLREEHNKIDELTTVNKSLEAELSVIKSSLTSETTMRKQEEKVHSNLEHELAHVKKTYEDAKRTFDQRIKDEQRHTLDAVSKTEADVRYYKGALEKLRDEAGKKESVLTKDIHSLKAEVAKKDVKVETQSSQLRSQEEELKLVKQDAVHHNREISRTNSALLAEANKTKRLEDKVRDLDTEIRRLNQKTVNSTTDWSRRENVLRADIKEKDEALVRANSKIASLEKRLIGQDEEIRRLNSRL